MFLALVAVLLAVLQVLFALGSWNFHSMWVFLSSSQALPVPLRPVLRPLLRALVAPLSQTPLRIDIGCSPLLLPALILHQIQRAQHLLPPHNAPKRLPRAFCLVSRWKIC